MQEVSARSDGNVRIWPAAMYGLLRELEADGLIVETDKRPSEDDERRRYFSLTPLGKRVLGEEVRRLEAIVDLARATRALRGRA
jgi:DNA-binding PadR family transcriptional regulator